MTTGQKQARKLNVEDSSNKTGTRRDGSNMNSEDQTDQSYCNSPKNVEINLSHLNLDGNVCIPVEVLDAASNILRKKLQEDMFGLVPPSIITK